MIVVSISLILSFIESICVLILLFRCFFVGIHNWNVSMVFLILRRRHMQCNSNLLTNTSRGNGMNKAILIWFSNDWQEDVIHNSERATQKRQTTWEDWRVFSQIGSPLVIKHTEKSNRMSKRGEIITTPINQETINAMFLWMRHLMNRWNIYRKSRKSPAIKQSRSFRRRNPLMSLVPLYSVRCYSNPRISLFCCDSSVSMDESTTPR